MTQQSFNADERAAMRAYVQRSEVRLSTMHRVAGVFLNGAGLLILLPVLFRDIVQGIIALLIDATKADLSGTNPTGYLYIALGVPFVVSMYIPLRALYLLLKDLVDFYFVGQSPGYPSRLFNPRFILSGIAFSPDESKAAKNEIIRHEYENLTHFVLPFDEDHASYFNKVKAQAGDDIIPSTRTRDLLRDILPPKALDTDATTVERFSVAFGLAGVVDRDLVDEVAKTETSLVRHALSLRRLVLRYAKALLAVIWTTLASFAIVSLSKAFSSPAPLIAILYALWAISMPQVVKLPIRWIFETADQNSGTRVTAKDIHLVSFEREITILSAAAAVVSGVILAISLLI